ncbi:hypothetical protein [Burkholderia multivorans]|jgi:hypothetical protein|uniref:hypothetical protein n=1 Tax=Burkholderia multivorans TaxID=87883 RepID=UPI001C25027F|nr:hypothetical protein [Burkholderia multivorans]MBU9220139.1 hypothetical protein [Burkholderia multivorans]MDN7609535.1 hypothetical protein [Burkholderia multivorans]
MGNAIRTGVVVGGLLLAVIVIAFVASMIGKPENMSANMASWIQAIGSIAAIGGAYFIGRRDEIFQRELIEQARAERIANRRSTLKALVDDAYARAKQLEFSASKDGDLGLLAFVSVSADTMRDSIEQLRSLPVFDFESGGLVRAVLGIRRECESLLGFMEYYNDNRIDKQEYYAGDVALKDAMGGHFAKLDSYYQAFIDIAGGDRVVIEPPQFY